MKDINCDNFVQFYDARSHIELPRAPGSEEDNFSVEARDLVKRLLQIDPSKRIQSVSEIKQHAFFAEQPIIPDQLPRFLFDRNLTLDELLCITERMAQDRDVQHREVK